MPNTSSNLLSPTEILDIYDIPHLNNEERQKHFTVTNQELQTLKAYKTPNNAAYFLISLVFFKAKHTFVELRLEQIHTELKYLLNSELGHKKIFNTIISHVKCHIKLSTLSLPPKPVQSKIKSKILTLTGYTRFTGSIKDKIQKELEMSASRFPRQRQLCKEFLNICIAHKVAIPGYTTIQDVVSITWNLEHKRVVNLYVRYTTLHERKIILSLLDKTNHLHHIVSIKHDLKSFGTHDLRNEIAKQEILKPIFEIAKLVLPKLALPVTTVQYYASLVHYYSGPGLKQLSPQLVGLYLLAYVYTRYQILNDNLLEAFKKRTMDFQNDAKDYATLETSKYIDKIKETRAQISKLLVAIDGDPHPTHISKEMIYSYIPKPELLVAALLLIDDNLDKDLLFWKYIDDSGESIKINLRKLFLNIDFVVRNHSGLRDAVIYMKEYLESHLSAQHLFDDLAPLKALFAKEYHKYVFGSNGQPIYNRCEFLLYIQMVYHMSTNKLTLEYSIKHKQVEDELIQEKRWKKDKSSILHKLQSSKLLTPIKVILKEKQNELSILYQKVNKSISDGTNTHIKIKKDANGKDTWRLSPIEKCSDPNDSFFAQMDQKSIIDVIRFVNQKLDFGMLFEPILPKSSQSSKDISVIMAIALANAMRISTRKMSSISDLTLTTLLTTENTFMHAGAIMAVVDRINNEVAKLPIYKKWYINSILHGSLDGLKLGVSKKNIKARYSKKYFGTGIGVAGYNEIVNFLSVASRIIGANEYEGHFAFEMAVLQNTSEIKPQALSTDKHGINVLNFALFDFVDLIFAPRIPKPHKETLWGFGKAEDYENMLIRPTRFINESLLYKEWDNIQRLVSSILTGETSPQVIIRKLASKDYSSDTKKALAQYNHIIRSRFILLYIHDADFRRAIGNVLNRGEQYNRLYRSITILNNGELKGTNEIDMEIYNQCTRLIASIIHFYNAYILNSFYETAHNEEEREFIASISPTAWTHVNLLGYYQFKSILDDKATEKLIDEWIKKCDWRQAMDLDFENDLHTPVNTRKKKYKLVKQQDS